MNVLKRVGQIILLLPVIGFTLMPLATVSADTSGASGVSLGDGNVQPNSGSLTGSTTPDGRYVIFGSYATNLVPNFVPQTGTGTAAYQVFMHDRVSGATKLISVNNSGVTADEASYPGAITPDGRYVTFGSYAANMGGPISKSGTQCYLRDLQQNTTTEINPYYPGPYGRAVSCGTISPDGNLLTISGSSIVPSNFPGFSCPVNVCDWSGSSFLFNRDTGDTTPIGIDSSGQYGTLNSNGVWYSYQATDSHASNDGSIVTFFSADALVPGVSAGWHLYVRNIITGDLHVIAAQSNQMIAPFGDPVVSGNGRYVAYMSDILHSGAQTYNYKIYEHDLQSGTEKEVDVSTAGDQSSGASFEPSISYDGTYVAFRSDATNLTVQGGTASDHIYVRNMLLGATRQADLNSAGDQANSYSEQPSVTENGSVVFYSYATNLEGIASDTPSPQVYFSPALQDTSPAPQLVNAISAGSTNGSGSFVADTYFTGGTPYSSTARVDTSGVTNPAPETVYQSVRYGNTFNYTFPGLTPNAAYTLKLDFNELYWGAQAGGGVGSRVFNVAVNGTAALTNFDIFAAAGGANKAVTKQIYATADSNGNVTATFTTDTDNAMVNGLELYSGSLPPLPAPPAVTSAYIAAGSSAATNSFSADQDFNGGTPYSSTASVDTSGVTNPAPETVYQAVRYGNSFRYTIPNLTPNTNFNVRLDFNELYWGTALSGNQGGAGSRLFSVGINGTQVLNNFDVFAIAGGANKAIAENFTALSDANGNITIQFTTNTDNAMVSGIEVTQE